MKRISQTAFALSLAVTVAPQLAATEEVFAENVIVRGELLCAGLSCSTSEPPIPSRQGLKLDSVTPAILFDDTSSNLGGPHHDWQLTANDDLTAGPDFFKIEDVTAGTAPFHIKVSAPTDSLVIGTTGGIGIGTSLPQRELHLLDGNQPAIRLEQDGSSGFPARIWDIATSLNGFQISDVDGQSAPFLIRPDATDFALVVAQNGNVGLGNFSPQGKLHTRGDGVQIVYFESGNGGPVQVRMRSDSQNRRFLATDNANRVKSQIIFGDNDIRFTGATDSGPNLWLTISPNGIVSQGPTCGTPCDLTFDPDVFTVPAIAERAAFMWDNKHLPAIGPTSPDTPMNLTEKMGGVIHELEIAHIYIEQQQKQMDRMEDQFRAQITAQRELNARLLARLDALEGG